MNSGVHASAFFQDLWSTLLAGDIWRGRICNRTPGGELYWVDSTITHTRDALGKVDGFLVFRTDITELKNLNLALSSNREALAEESAFVRALFDSLNAHMAVLDPDGRILKVNEAWMRFARENGADAATTLGVGRSYFEGGAFELDDADEATAGIVGVQTGLLPSFRMEYPCHSETSRHWFSMCVLPVAGHPGTVIVAHENITEARRLSEERRHLDVQLAEACRLETLGALAGGVAHDMNNVLGAILVIATATLEKQVEGSPVRPALDTISKAASRGGQMVNTLLQFARRNTVKRLEEEVDMTTVLREVVQLLAWTTLAEVDLRLDLAEGLPPIQGDGGALVHALMNLCTNAVDALPADGTLTLRSRSVEGAWVEVRVEDSGCGMARDVLERALEPFFTTKGGKGTGLGLPSVQSTVLAHGGQMSIRSEAGKGTCVALRFPIRKDDQGLASPS